MASSMNQHCANCIDTLFTHCRSVANSKERWDVFSSVCLLVCVFFLCQHDNFQTSKRRMMKLGVGASYKNLGRVQIWES